MDIKKFLPDKDAEREYFWSLVIEPGWVQAGIWQIESDKAKVVFSSPPFTWETDEELVQSADDALSAAIQGFPEENIEPTKSVFGVSASWVEEGNITPQYLEKIKKLCSELSLTPIGFVVLPEAIAHYIKSEEGGPLTAVVLGVYSQVIELSLFRLGNLSGNTTISRSVSIVDDVIEGFARLMDKDHVPSRFILYDGKEGELEEARQALLKVNWEDYENLKLLHTPKIELVSAKTKVYAVSLAGASELANINRVEVASEDFDRHEREVGKEETQEKKILGEESDIEPSNITPEELGFAVDRDVSEETGFQPSAPESVEAKAQEVTKEGEIDETMKNIVPVGTKAKMPFGGKKLFEGFGGFFTNATQIVRSLRLPKLGFLGHGKNTFIYGVGFLFLLFVLGFLAWWFLPKSEITVYVSPKRLEETYDLKVRVDGATDYSQRVLRGVEIKEKVEGEKTKDTTGTKTVGDKAKGEVIIYRVGGEITLDAGTILTGPGSLRFSLDNEVKVASGSASTPGTTKVGVTAEDIGAQYNLASGGAFSVGNYSTVDMEAKNEAAFSGGSSREIRAVSEEDLDVLEKDLEDELKERAKELVKSDLGEDEYFLEESLSATSSAKTFSAKVGDEAESLKLFLTIEVVGLKVSKKEIGELSVEVLKDKVPQGFSLRGEQIDYSLEPKRIKDDEYEFEVRVSANLLPGVDTNEVIQQIKGRSFEAAQEYMKTQVPGFVRAEIKTSLTLPGKLKTLPHMAKNIDIEVAAER